MRFPWCNQEQDLGLLGKYCMLKLASSCYWKAAMILPTYEAKLIYFAHFPLNLTCSPAHVFLFVMSLERFMALCQGRSSCFLMTAPRGLQVSKGNSCSENHGCSSKETQIVGSKTVWVSPGEKTVESGKEPWHPLILHVKCVAGAEIYTWKGRGSQQV